MSTFYSDKIVSHESNMYEFGNLTGSINPRSTELLLIILPMCRQKHVLYMYVLSQL